jgi:DNA-binding XRE family transcriptional regulator
MSSERTAQIADGFAERLRTARTAAGLSIRALAAKAGITHQSVVAYEAEKAEGLGSTSPVPSLMRSESRQAGSPTDAVPSIPPQELPCTLDQA